MDLSSNAIEDIGPVLRLARLQHLNLNYNEICDIFPISNSNRLEIVRFSDNRISNRPDMIGFGRLGELDLSRNRLSNVSGLTWLSSLSRLKLEGNPLNRAAYRREIPLITKRNGGLHNERQRRAPKWIRGLSPRLTNLIPWYKGMSIVPNGKFTYDADSNYWLEAGIFSCLVVYITVRLIWRRRRRKMEAVVVD